MKTAKPYCVYFHINPITKDVFYVGIGIHKRPYKKSNRNPYWVKYVNKNGVKVLITDTNLTIGEAIEKEIFWISFFGRKDLGVGKLLNMTNGGEGAFGAIRSQEVRNRMSLASKNRPRTALSEEHRMSISLSLKGKKHSDEHRKNNSLSKIKSYKENGNMGMRGKSVSDATKIKLSEIHKGRGLGRKLPKEQIEKIRQSNIGKKRTPEQRLRISVARRKGIELRKAS